MLKVELKYSQIHSQPAYIAISVVVKMQIKLFFKVTIILKQCKNLHGQYDFQV